jgi:hypothetical protein
MPGNTTGQRNVGVGDMALFSNTSGTENTALGSGALFSNSSGQYNVAVGRNSMTTTNASYNTAVGFAALRQNSAGVNNTAIGYEALRGVLGSGNVGVGYQAGRLETGSNRLYIENSNADATTALIYGEFDNDILRVNGQVGVGVAPSAGNKLEVSGKTKTTNFQMTTGAAANYILQSDASGNATWATDNATLSVMRTNLNADQALNTGGWQIINFNTVVFDLNTEFVGVTHRFVAAKTGYYEVNAGYHTNDQSNNQFYSIGVYKNGAGPYQQTSENHSNLGQVSRKVSCIMLLTAGDYVEIYAENYQSGVTLDSYSAKTYFEVKQIR